MKKRICKKCGATLSRLNKNDTCWCHGTDVPLELARLFGYSSNKAFLSQRGIQFCDGDGKWNSHDKLS